MTLQKKMARGALWSVIEKGGQQFVSFFVFLVIARLVGPEEYGTAMLCFTYLSFTNLLLSSLADGIVANQIKDRERLSSLFWAIMGLGLILTLFCFSFAGAMASLLGSTKLVFLFRLLSIVPLLLAGTCVPYAIVLREMNFKILAIRSLVAATGSGIVGTLMAFYGFGAVSLVAQQVMLYAIMNLILWAFIDWKPKAIFHKGLIVEALRPGLNLMGSNIVSFCEEQIPRIFIGQTLGPKNVGFFAFAFRMRQSLQEIVIYPAFLALYPALSGIKDDDAQQKKVVGQTIFLVCFLVFPTLSLASLAAPLYVPLLFGKAWIAAIPLLRLFIMQGTLLPFVNTVRILCRTHNKVGHFAKLQAALGAVMLGAIYFLAHRDLMSVAWGVFGLTLGGLPVYFHFLRRWLGFDLWEPLLQNGKALVSTAFMSATVYAFMQAHLISNASLNLAATVLLGGSVYVLLCLWIDRDRSFALFRFAAGVLRRSETPPQPKVEQRDAVLK